MRRIVIAAVITAGVGLVGLSAGSAAPVNNTALKQAATVNDPTIQVRHWGHWGWHHHRWGWGWHHHRHCHGWRSRWWWC